MPDIEKLLFKLSKKERLSAEFLIGKIFSLDWHNLDIKKLRGYTNVFRVRKGRVRVIFTKDNNEILVLTIGRRKEDTYKFQ